MREKLAIVGTGMSAMSAAYFLKDDYDITLFEKNDYIGGHTNTITVNHNGETATFDTGFMVFNEVTYPNMLKLFKHLEVPYEDTDMSFAVAHREKNLEYNGSGLSGLFGQKRNLFNPKFIKTLMEINRFNQTAVELIKKEKLGISLGDFLKKHNFSDEMKNIYLIPMSSAVWSTPHENMNQFPAMTLIRFFENHGFLGLNTQHQWKTVIGGSIQYRDRLISSFKDKIKTNSPVDKVTVEKDGKVSIKSNGETFNFDKCLMASHSDESLKMRENPTDIELKLLSAFRYQENIATVHTDESVMPKKKNVWSSWNYITEKENKNFTVYWMNSLQGVSEKNNYFININGEQFVDQNKIIKQITYHHPVFNTESEIASKDLPLLNNHDTPIYYAGAYMRYGFHEDALISGMNAAKSLLELKGKELPWPMS